MYLQDMLGPDGFPAQLPDNDVEKHVVLAKDFVARATTVLHNRAFKDSEPYPPRPRYLVFASTSQAHASHYMTRWFDTKELNHEHGHSATLAEYIALPTV